MREDKVMRWRGASQNKEGSQVKSINVRTLGMRTSYGMYHRHRRHTNAEAQTD